MPITKRQIKQILEAWLINNQKCKRPIILTKISYDKNLIHNLLHNIDGHNISIHMQNIIFFQGIIMQKKIVNIMKLVI